MSKSRTHNGAVQYAHSLDSAVEFFSKAGSLFERKKKGKKVSAYYGETESVLKLFESAWNCDKEIAMKLLFWLRDCRGGAGNRSGFRICLNWLAKNEPKWINANIESIPLYGRYDDFRSCFGTKVQKKAVDIWADAIKNKDGLACKWADRKDAPLLDALREDGVLTDIGEFRRWLAEGRKNIVERNMCSKEWKSINYEHVPSVAMSRYTKAFTKHDSKRFESFKNKVEKGEAKINASTVFPHDLARTVRCGDAKTADLQFTAMPDYMKGTDARIMVICDSSGSMSSTVAGSIEAIDVSTSLSLYCSDRVGKDNPFYRKFMQFESESTLTDWNGKTFSQCYGRGYGSRNGIFDGAVGSTDIGKALNTLLNYALKAGATNDQIPNMLLIISDMQFDSGCSRAMTPVEEAMKKWEAHGYTRPKIVYWNVTGYAGQPTTALHNDVGLVSGFSPSILEAVLNADDFSPRGIMLKKLEKYKVNVPK